MTSVEHFILQQQELAQRYPATPKQVAFLKRLMAEREHGLSDNVLNLLNSKDASVYIDGLLKLPVKAEAQSASPSADLVTVKQVGFIASLVKSRKGADEVVAKALASAGKPSVDELPKRSASTLINTLLTLPEADAPAKPASEAQVNYIVNLAKRKQNGAETVQQALVTAGVAEASLLNTDQAKSLIDLLGRTPDIRRVVQVEVGAYNHDGVVYSVRQGAYGRFRAYKWNDSIRKWVEAGAVLFDIVPEERLSLVDAMRFGAQTGTCVHCGRTLTDADSVRYGLGTVCIKRYK